MKTQLNRFIAALFVLLFATGTQVKGQTTQSLSYQGVLRTAGSAGNTLVGNHILTVTLYSDADGTQKLWQQAITTLVDSTGVFNCTLGSPQNPLPDAQTLDRPIWLGLAVDNAAELRPLSQITASAYAINVVDNAVTTQKLANNTVTTAKLADASVTSEKIADSSITASKMNTDYVSSISVNGEQIPPGNVNILGGNGVDIAYDPITQSVLFDGEGLKGNAQTMSADWNTSGNSLSGGEVLGSTNSEDLSIITDNTEAVHVLNSDQFVGLGTASPNTRLHVETSDASNTNERILTVDHESSGVTTSTTGYGANIGFVLESADGGGTHTEADMAEMDVTYAFNGAHPISNYALQLNTGGSLNNVWRAEIGTSFVNIIGGWSGNSAAGEGNTIAGGGSNNGGTYPNTATSDYGAICGGTHNTVAHYGSITGGWTNTASGDFSTVSGGSGNQAIGISSVVAGGGQDGWTSGFGNIAGGDYSAIGGGDSNYVASTGQHAVIAGGSYNQIMDASDNSYSAILGGFHSHAYANYVTIGGGYYSNASGTCAFVGGGGDPTFPVSSGNSASGDRSVVVGGSFNSATIDYAIVVGGGNNRANAYESFIGGGAGNETDPSADGSVIAGGGGNQITVTSFDAEDCAIGGGNSNIINDAENATIAGGENNSITSVSLSSTIGGGENNTASAEAATIPGGSTLTANLYSQTVIGDHNLVIPGTTTSIPTNTTQNDDREFVIGNGTWVSGGEFPDFYSGPAPSNAFEVSYDGHSIVHDVNGNGHAILGSSARKPFVGGAYVDNTLAAWAIVTAPGTWTPGLDVTPAADFGVQEIKMGSTAGVYNITLTPRQDPNSTSTPPATIALGTGAVVVTPMESCKFVSSTDVSSGSFTITTTSYSSAPEPTCTADGTVSYMFMVVGR